MEQTIRIKNMVCPRCITAVKIILEEFGISYTSIKLGEVKIDCNLSVNQKKVIRSKLESIGFELIESEKSALVSRIRTLIINQLHHSSDDLKVNFSVYLAEKTKRDYAYLSRLFSMIEGVTIERFILKQKIERIKEYLFYNEKTLSEIAIEMNYSSVAYLSTQFKKETGLTPTEFKKMKQPNHQNLDQL